MLNPCSKKKFCFKRLVINAIVAFINRDLDLCTHVKGNVKNVYVVVTDDSDSSVDFLLDCSD